jgi:hypothetical protein
MEADTMGRIAQNHTISSQALKHTHTHTHTFCEAAAAAAATTTIMVLPLETVLMRHFGLSYCSARALTLEARANLGMKRDERWTPPLLNECRRLHERGHIIRCSNSFDTIESARKKLMKIIVVKSWWANVPVVSWAALMQPLNCPAAFFAILQVVKDEDEQVMEIMNNKERWW